MENSKEEITNIYFNGVSFDDKEKTIIIDGHFDDWLCGALSAIDHLLLEGKFKGTYKYLLFLDEELSKALPDRFQPYLQSAYKFKTKKDYIWLKELIIYYFNMHKEKKLHSAKEIKETMKNAEWKNGE